MGRFKENKLISVFMEISEDYIDFNLDELNYHSDWNLLMLVVEKIESMGYMVDIKNNWVVIHKDGQSVVVRIEEGKTKKEDVYEGIVEFIKWYNLNKNN